jgi:hypothetical protein
MTDRRPDRLPGPKPRAAGFTVTRGGSLARRTGNSCENFEDINTLAALGSLPRPHRLRLFPVVGGLPQLPLFDESDLPVDIVREHYRAAALPAPVFLYGIPGHELGGGGLLQRDGQVFCNPDVIPPYFGAYLREGGDEMPAIWQGALYLPDAEIYEVDVPVALALHPNVVYGHFLLEILPRLHLLSSLRRAGLPFLTALHYQIPDWAKRMIRLYFEPDEIIWYDRDTTRLSAPCFILPSMMQTHGCFHPAFNLAIDEIKAHVLPNGPQQNNRRIWLSRRLHRGFHGIENEDEVEAVVASLGYEITHPQTLTFPEQVALMDSAGIVACAYGSATHNSMFANRGTKVFCINRLNWYQSGIGALRSQPMAYCPPDDGRFRGHAEQGQPSARFKVNCDVLRDQLRRFEDWRIAEHQT